MPESFDAFEFLNYLRSRWRFIATACGLAVGLTLLISLLLPKKYTATARIVIDPPAGSDLRAAMAVSPIYLESLRTYEHFAQSDSLFLRALDRFQLRDPLRPVPVESLKGRVLNVGIVRNTKVLEINATLPDPKKAQQLASFLAEETVQLNRQISRQEDDELTADAERQFAEARKKLEAEERMYADVMTRDQTEGLTAEVGSMQALSARLRRQMAELDAVVAEYRAREKEPGRETELASIRSELRSAAARAEYLKKQISELESDMVRKRSLLLQSTARRDQARGRRDGARDAYDGADKRLREVKNGAGYRGERLSIIDPGIVPERPSSPNAPLNVFSAFLASLVFSVVWVTFEHSLARERRESVRAALRAAGKGHDV